MMLVPAGVRVHIALGVTDLRKGLAMLVQGVLEQDPFSGHLFAFRGRKANLIKIVFWDGTGLCLFTKRLETGRFPWPSADEIVRTTDARDNRPTEPRSYGSCVADLYNGTRTHLSLGEDAPLPRAIQRNGRIQSIPHIGGLHRCLIRI